MHTYTRSSPQMTQRHGPEFIKRCQGVELKNTHLYMAYGDSPNV